MPVMCTFDYKFSEPLYNLASFIFYTGGITTLVDMPLNSFPSTVSRETLELKLKAAESRIYVDVGMFLKTIC